MSVPEQYQPNPMLDKTSALGLINQQKKPILNARIGFFTQLRRAFTALSYGKLLLHTLTALSYGNFLLHTLTAHSYLHTLTALSYGTFFLHSLIHHDL
jgi:hypothetical protein